jgi:hypothetical protein
LLNRKTVPEAIGVGVTTLFLGFSQVATVLLDSHGSAGQMVSNEKTGAVYFSYARNWFQ